MVGDRQTAEHKDWREELYLGLMPKREEIIKKFQELIGQTDGGIGALEKGLLTNNQNGKDSPQTIGYLVLGMVHTYAKEGDYNKALELLNKHRERVIEVAGTPSISGLLYVTLLDSAIRRELEGQQTRSTTTSTKMSDYFDYINKNHLTADIRNLLIRGVKVIQGYHF